MLYYTTPVYIYNHEQKKTENADYILYYILYITYVSITYYTLNMCLHYTLAHANNIPCYTYKIHEINHNTNLLYSNLHLSYTHIIYIHILMYV